MLGSVLASTSIKAGIVLLAAFSVLAYLFPDGQLHEILNGMFVGVGVVIFMTFRKLTFDTLLGRGEFARAQRMALGIALLWIAFNIRTLQSIVYRATNEQQWILNLPVGAFVTLLAIVAGYLQVTSPGFKPNQRGFLHGQPLDRVILAAIIGLAVGAAVIWFQSKSLLSEQQRLQGSHSHAELFITEAKPTPPKLT